MSATGSRSELRIAVIGDHATAEMQVVPEMLSRLVADSQIVFYQKISDFGKARLAEHLNFGLVLVCQNWPGEYDQHDVIQLLKLAPLTRLLCCQSLWSESDGRNHHVWPAAMRTAARSASSRIDLELAILSGLGTALPLTASRDEIVAQQLPARWPQFKQQITAAILSPDRELKQWVCELLQQLGMDVCPEPDRAALVIWDLDPCSHVQIETLQAFVAAHPQTSLFALMGLPTAADRALLESTGVQAVISKSNATPEILQHLNAQFAKSIGPAYRNRYCD